MRRPRPYIPLSVRVAVAERQFPKHRELWALYLSIAWNCDADRLGFLLDHLSQMFGDVLQLDHDPALILRKYKVDQRKPEAAWFTPNANDPDHLIYRPLREHLQKTVGRKADAEKTVTTKGSDSWLKTKFRRLEQPTKKRPSKIPARAKPWPKRPFPKKTPAIR